MDLDVVVDERQQRALRSGDAGVARRVQPAGLAERQVARAEALGELGVALETHTVVDDDRLGSCVARLRRDDASATAR